MYRTLNVFIKPKGDKPPSSIGFDSPENNNYSLRTFTWSPNSKKLVAYHIRPGNDREITCIESSPTDHIQPKHTTLHYAKPGDTLDISVPVLFDAATRRQIEIDHALFPNPFAISTPAR